MTYIPYETLSRVEADEIASHLPTSLNNLTSEQLLALKELTADGVARGIELGFAISDFSGQDPGTLLDAYNAGVVEGSRNE